MAWSLPDLITEGRQRIGLALPQNFAPALNPLSDAALARAANEAQVHLVREAIRMTSGAYATHNKGLFLRQICSTVESDGKIWLPDDLETLVGVSQSSDAFDRLRDFNDVQLLGGHCAGEYLRAFDHLQFPVSLAGAERWVIYNSNMDKLFTAGSVSSGTLTTLVSGSSPTYSTIPIASHDDAYNGMTLWVKNGAGTITQRARIKDYVGSTRTFTIYGEWQSFVPTSVDSWSIMSALGRYDELMLYETFMRLPWGPRSESFMGLHRELRINFNSSVQAVHSYER